MEQRIEVLEREVGAIKSEIAVIKTTYWMREDARAFDGRLSHLEIQMAQLTADVERLKVDVAQLKIDVARLQVDVARLQVDVAKLQVDVAKLQEDVAEIKLDLLELKGKIESIHARMDQMATKVELYQVQANLKAWMIGIFLSTITVTSTIQFALFRAFTS